MKKVIREKRWLAGENLLLNSGEVVVGLVDIGNYGFEQYNNNIGEWGLSAQEWYYVNIGFSWLCEFSEGFPYPRTVPNWSCEKIALVMCQK